MKFLHWFLFRKSCKNCGHKRKSHCASFRICYEGEQWLSSREVSISQEIERDSDQVEDLGLEFKGKKHLIFENYGGKSKLYCPKTKHVYLHIISVPNKFALLCRGCGETVY